jgi:hypothetical protein
MILYRAGLLAGLIVSSTSVVAQVMPSAQAQRPAPQQVASTQPLPTQAVSTVQNAPQQGVAQHPLIPALEMAKRVQANMDANLKDYSATIVKHERIDGQLGDPEYAFVKIRQKPFSVYMKFIGPKSVEGQECMYAENANDGKMFAHAPPGTLKYKFGTVSLAPTSALAMHNQRYPITEMGISNLTTRLIEVGEKDKQYGECDVKFYQGAKVSGRVCTMIQCVHPVPRRNFLFNVARIYLDDELQMPIRYEAYDWPEQQGGDPVLLEEYTYLNLKINQGFTDADFDVHNPNYGFNMK